MNTSYQDSYRNNCASLINKVLENDKKSRQIEKSIYNCVIDYSKVNNIKRNWDNTHFKSLYLSRIRSVYTNLKCESYLKNNSFKERIISGEIDCETISSLSHYDIFPEKWSELFEERARKEKLKYELKPEAMTDIFKCHRCSSRSCTYYEVQTRSADEPMTQFITCLDCNNHWKQ